MSLNITTRELTTQPQPGLRYGITHETSFTCDTVIVRLDPYDMEHITLEEERGYVVIKHNDRVITQIRIEEP